MKLPPVAHLSCDCHAPVARLSLVAHLSGSFHAPFGHCLRTFHAAVTSYTRGKYIILYSACGKCKKSDIKDSKIRRKTGLDCRDFVYYGLIIRAYYVFFLSCSVLCYVLCFWFFTLLVFVFLVLYCLRFLYYTGIADQELPSLPCKAFFWYVGRQHLGRAGDFPGGVVR